MCGCSHFTNSTYQPVKPFQEEGQPWPSEQVCWVLNG